jgi:hypothetical protein
LYCKGNEEIMREVQIPQITEFIEKYRINWREHVNRVTSDRISE